jgi:hypothetical protein
LRDTFPADARLSVQTLHGRLTGLTFAAATGVPAVASTAGDGGNTERADQSDATQR